MKLFSRGTQEDDDFENDDLPTKEDLKDDFFVGEEAPVPAVGTRKKPKYGIEDAIELLRELPRENNELVVTVVNKTLQSMDIVVGDIIKDADAKEARIRKQHKALEQEVKELQGKIAKRNQEMSDMLGDLKETTEVKKRLQIALELEGKMAAHSKATKPTPPAQAPRPSAKHGNNGQGDKTTTNTNEGARTSTTGTRAPTNSEQA